LLDPADAGSAKPPAPIAKAAAPFTAVFLTNFLRVILYFAFSDESMAHIPSNDRFC
jgi:hypothetical protein